MPNLNLTKLVTNQDTFGEMVEKINSNFDIVSQAQGLRGEEGKRGTSGVPGPPGVIGPIGSSGSAGERGSRWYFGDSFTAFDKTSTKTGDFFLEGDTGSVYEKISDTDPLPNQWDFRGTIVGSGSGGSSLFEDFIPTTNNKTTIIKPLKTNYTLEITDITGTSPNFTAEPFSSVGADTSDFVMGGSSTTQNWLQEMGLKIYTSESDTLSAIYGKGKNLHLSNSTAFVYNKLLGWQNQSGFTLTVDWGGTGNRHEETLKISNVASGNIDHKQIIDLTANEIQFNADETFVNSPFILHSLSTVNINSLASPNAGTLVYDTTANAVFSYEGSPLSWKKLSETGTGGGGNNYGKVRTFDNANVDKGIDVLAGSSTDVLRIKEGSGITISAVNVGDEDPANGTYTALMIGLSQNTATATDYFGTAEIHRTNQIESINASGNDTIKFQEGENITLSVVDGKITITAVEGPKTFQGFKYKFGQTATSPFATAPLQLQPVEVTNNGSLDRYKNLKFPTEEINKSSTSVINNDVESQTIFKPGIKGYWQINAFAFGLVELPDSINSYEKYVNYSLTPTTIAGGIIKDGSIYSYLTIAESSTVSPVAYFGNNNLPENTSYFPWPSWTLNCSDIIYVDENPEFSITIGIGGLYAPNINNGYNTTTNINLWYMSGFFTATYLGTSL